MEAAAKTAEMANPWHDQIGRFAPKGTGRLAGSGDGDEPEVAEFVEGPRDPRSYFADMPVELLDHGLRDLGESEMLGRIEDGQTQAQDDIEHDRFIDIVRIRANVEELMGNAMIYAEIFDLPNRKDADWLGQLLERQAYLDELERLRPDLRYTLYEPELVASAPPPALPGDLTRAEIVAFAHRLLEFANPWHDELGQFAPKGYGTNREISHIAPSDKKPPSAATMWGQWSVQAADGSTLTLTGPGAPALTDAQRGDALNALADVYDLAPLAGETPRIWVDNGNTRQMLGLKDKVLGWVTRESPGMINLVATPKNGWDEQYTGPASGRVGFQMPSATQVSKVRYSVTHEYGHSYLYVNEFDQEWPTIRSLYDTNELRSHMSVYAKKDPREAHAEMFAEYFGTAGSTSNVAAKRYAETLGWDDELVRVMVDSDVLVATVGADELPAIIADTDTGPIYMYDDGTVVDLSDPEPMTASAWRDEFGKFASHGGEGLVAAAGEVVSEFEATYLDDLEAAVGRATDKLARLAVERLRAKAVEFTEDETLVAAGPFRLSDANVMTPAEWAEAFEVEAADIIGDVVVDAATGQPLIAGLNVDDKVITDLIREHVGRLRESGVYVQRSLTQTLQTAVRNLTPLDEVVEQIMRRGPLGESSARAVARTELTAATNGGMLVGWRKDDIPFKAWRSLHDDRVRDAHLAADGQIRPTEQPFEVGGHRAMYPGDPKLPIELRINCRCYMERLGVDGMVVKSRLLGGTRRELYRLAQQVGLEGRSTMNKRQLLKALNDYRNGFGRQALSQMTKAQLLARAKDAQIRGRWRMSKPQLMRALRRKTRDAKRRQMDAGHADKVDVEAARAQLEDVIRQIGMPGLTGTGAPSGDDLTAIRVAVYGLLGGEDRGWIPCVGCGAKLHWGQSDGLETISLVRSNPDLPWSSTNVIPCCRADAAAIAEHMPDRFRVVELATGPATIELANPWHDQIGRFAPKGTGTMSLERNRDAIPEYRGEGIAPEDPRLEQQSLDWALYTEAAATRAAADEILSLDHHPNPQWPATVDDEDRSRAKYMLDRLGDPASDDLSLNYRSQSALDRDPADESLGVVQTVANGVGRWHGGKWNTPLARQMNLERGQLEKFVESLGPPEGGGSIEFSLASFTGTEAATAFSPDGLGWGEGPGRKVLMEIQGNPKGISVWGGQEIVTGGQFRVLSHTETADGINVQLLQTHVFTDGELREVAT